MYVNIRIFSPTLQRRYVETTSSKMPFTDKDGHLTKAFKKEKHDNASQLLDEYANRNWSRRRLNLFRKIDKFGSVWTSRYLIVPSLFSSVASRGRGISTCVKGGDTHCKH